MFGNMFPGGAAATAAPPSNGQAAPAQLPSNPVPNPGVGLFGGTSAPSAPAAPAQSPAGLFGAPPASAVVPNPSAGTVQQVPPAATGLPPTPPPPAFEPPARGTPINGGPPWIHVECRACRIGDQKDVNTGVGTSGDPCLICRSRQQHLRGITPDMFRCEYSNGQFGWEVKAEFAQQVSQVAPNGLLGRIATPWVKGAPQGAAPATMQGVPAPAATQAPVQAPAQAPGATHAPAQASGAGFLGTAQVVPTTTTVQVPTQAPIVQQQAPQEPQAQQQAPVQSPAQAQAPTPAATGKKKSATFTLCVGCEPEGVSGVYLPEVWQRWCQGLAQQKNVASYYQINVFERRDLMASAIPNLIETEKFGSKWVISPKCEAATDYAAFVEVLRSHAGTVVARKD